MGKVIKFPTQKELKGYRIPLYTQGEVLVVQSVLLLYAKLYGYHAPISMSTLKKIEPEIVINCLGAAIASNMFSKDATDVMKKILCSIEEVRIAQ